MRSDLVFSAAINTPNRYLLCRMISLSTRHVLNRRGSFAEGINSCLALAGKDDGIAADPLQPMSDPRRIEALLEAQS